MWVICLSTFRIPQLSTKLLEGDKVKDSLKLLYDFQNRFGECTDTAV